MLFRSYSMVKPTSSYGISGVKPEITHESAACSVAVRDPSSMMISDGPVSTLKLRVTSAGHVPSCPPTTVNDPLALKWFGAPGKLLRMAAAASSGVSLQLIVTSSRLA